MEHCVDEPQEIMMMEVEAPVDSPRPDSMARTLAIKCRTSKRVSILPRNTGIPEELSPKLVLKRQENELAMVKGHSGYRSTPRTSASSAMSEVGVTPSKATEGGVSDMDTDKEEMKIGPSEAEEIQVGAVLAQQELCQ